MRVSTLINSGESALKEWEAVLKICEKLETNRVTVSRYENVQGKENQFKEVLGKILMKIEDKDISVQDCGLLEDWLDKVAYVKQPGLSERVALVEEKIVSSEDRETKPVLFSSPLTKLPNTVLKPELLTRDFKPEEFDVWKSKFDGYFKTSEMENLPLDIQRTYIFSCLGSDILLDIERHVTKDTSVYGKDGILERLGSLFDQWYPIFTQRLEFLGSSRVNESKIDYTYRVIKEARRCKVSELKSKELTILKIIHGMDDSRIQKEALDQEKLLDIIRRMDGDASVNRMYQGRKSRKQV